MNLPILLGTGRKENKSVLVANVLSKAIKKAGHTSEVVSPKDHVENPFTERVGMELESGGEKYKEIITNSDALVVVIPEYNRSFPGELKLMIDLLYEEYKGKKFHLVGVSSGGTGGTRAVESFINVVVGVEAIPVKPKLVFPNVGGLFEENGNLTDTKAQERIEKFVAQLTS